ncbi:MAG: hypothetical protein NTY53_21280 [Kiritimatiellaeota bacterium]|nr:hypothetical protein [Kiritimatiellota bacterium]
MIRCDPMGICSWNYRLTGEAEEQTATIEIYWPGEQGAITTPSVHYQVVKLGMFSGTWQLGLNGKIVAMAEKPNPLTRRFEIKFGEETAILEAESPLSRIMVLSTPDGKSGVITPAHPFTRRATMEDTGLPFELHCFAFWLSAILWRRAANSSAAAPAT